MSFYSPLRYPGGKGQLANAVKELVIHNKLSDCTYAEPYAGGCGIGLHLLLRGYVSELIINDIDQSVFSFWRLVIDRPEDLIRKIENAPLTVAEWRRQKDILRGGGISDDVGFAFFYLNRTNRSGVLNGGVIGGLDQSGTYKIDARFNREMLADRIRKISKVRKRIRVTCHDGIDFLKHNKSKDCLFFIDPPYVEKGGRLYLNSYKSDDHVALSEFIIEEFQCQNWILTYDKNPLIYSLYKKFSPKKYTLQHSVKNSGFGVELIMMSESLSVPQDWSLATAA